MWIKKLKNLNFNFEQLPTDLLAYCRTLLSDDNFEYNEKKELLDNTVFDAVISLLPNNTAVQVVKNMRLQINRQVVNDGFNTVFPTNLGYIQTPKKNL